MLINKNIFFGALVVMTLLTVSCNSDRWLPQSTGAPYDILVVAEDSVWDAPAGAVLHGIFSQEIGAVAQAESQFSLSQLKPSQFTGIWLPVRNVVVVEVGAAENKIESARHKWAQGQLVITIVARTSSDLIRLLNEKSVLLPQLFVNEENNRERARWEQDVPTIWQDTLWQKMKLSLSMPREFVPVSETTDLSRYVFDSHRVRMEVIVYTAPSMNLDDLSVDRLIAQRDSVMKQRIPGPVVGTFVQTETQRIFSPKRVEQSQLEGIEWRGLWKMQGEMMGGTFISRIFGDTKHHRTIVVEVLIYAPGEKKRLLVNRAEAILGTLAIKSNPM